MLKVPPAVEQMVEEQVREHRYRSSDDVLLAAMQLLRRYEQHAQQRLRYEVKRGFDQLDRGEGIAIDGPGELRAFFDDIVMEADRELAAEAGVSP